MNHNQTTTKSPETLTEERFTAFVEAHLPPDDESEYQTVLWPLNDPGQFIPITGVEFFRMKNFAGQDGTYTWDRGFSLEVSDGLLQPLDTIVRIQQDYDGGLYIGSGETRGGESIYENPAVGPLVNRFLDKLQDFETNGQLTPPASQ